jgi:hypothetical protein
MAISDCVISTTALEGQRAQVTISMPYGANQSAEIVFPVDAPKVQHELVNRLLGEHLEKIKRAVADL